jgi:hypothetical protein
VNEARETGKKHMKIKLRPKQEPVPTGRIKDILNDEVVF